VILRAIAFYKLAKACEYPHPKVAFLPTGAYTICDYLLDEASVRDNYNNRICIVNEWLINTALLGIPIIGIFCYISWMIHLRYLYFTYIIPKLYDANMNEWLRLVASIFPFVFHLMVILNKEV
jgi:hypothetical protein